MRVLVACEYSGVVRGAMRERGNDAWSCDLLPSEDCSPYHVPGDVRRLLLGTKLGPWDLMVAHPPCTHLSSSGARWWPQKQAEQAEAIKFVLDLYDAPIRLVAIENPIGKLSTAWRRPDCIVQPWMFGDFETKATCWWTKGLPPLVPTYRTPAECAEALGLPTDSKPKPAVWLMGPSPGRWKERSRTYKGIGKAIASQWG